MSRVTQLFAKENAGAWLTLHETQSRDAIKYGRRTLAYVAIGADLWGQLLVDRFNQHEEILDTLREAERMVDAAVRNNPMPDDIAALGRIRSAIAKAEGR